MSKPNLKIAIYSDGADLEQMVKMHRSGLVQGFTTNPSLMAKAGIKDYEGFAKQVLSVIRDMPISFEVFSDEFDEMERQGAKIAAWAPNANVKIPITNTRGESALPLIQKMLAQGVKLNVTALFTQAQLDGLRKIMGPKDDVIVSIFAGRLADTGIDPNPLMKKAVADFAGLPGAKILWASTREVFNVFEAERCGCHIITSPPDIVSKVFSLYGKSPEDNSLETVKGFYKDSTQAGFKL